MDELPVATEKPKKQFGRGIWKFLGISIPVFFLILIVLFAKSLSVLSEVSQVFHHQSSPIEKVVSDISETPTVEVRPIDLREVRLPQPTMVHDVHLPTTTAKAILVRDVETNTYLFEKNTTTSLPLASITKLVSALVLLDIASGWEEAVTVPTDTIIDSQLSAGDIRTRQILWQMMLVGSSNKAALALVDSTGISRETFVVKMNEKAELLGMSSSFFVEPTGLSSENRASAHDVSLLLAEAFRRTEIVSAFGISSYTIPTTTKAGIKTGHVVWNTNHLLLGWIPHSFQKILGGKTGYIPESGYNVAERIEGRDGHIVDVIILGATTFDGRFTDARDVAEWIFSTFEWPGEEKK